MGEDDDFLSRWSRRKRAVADEKPAPEPEPGPEDVPEPAPQDEEGDEEAILARYGLPVPESLKPGDDISGFMAKGVPDFLRKRALRMLWRSNPVLANLDGLNDYDEDFTSPELTQKVLATAYQVGRGIVKKVAEDVGKGEAAPQDRSDETQPEVALASEKTPEILDENAELGEVDRLESDDPEPTKPRRMRFVT